MEIYEIDKLKWSYSSNTPQVTLEGGGYAEQVDPIPCYPHNIDVVKEWAKRAVDAFPMPPEFGPHIHVSHFEAVSRTNAWAQRYWNYQWEPKEGQDAKKHRPWTGYFFLNGKRTPIHPALTRYAVPHEYGHLVEFWLERSWGLQYEFADEKVNVREIYAKQRGMEFNNDYGPGNWHTNVGEIIANDFRILLVKAEVEFWPHPQIPRPEDVPGLRAWWKQQAKKHGNVGY